MSEHPPSLSEPFPIDQPALISFSTPSPNSATFGPRMNHFFALFLNFPAFFPGCPSQGPLYPTQADSGHTYYSHGFHPKISPKTGSKRGVAHGGPLVLTSGQPPNGGSGGPPHLIDRSGHPPFGGKPGSEFPYGKQYPPITLIFPASGEVPAPNIMQLLGCIIFGASLVSWGMLLGEPTPHTRVGTW